MARATLIAYAINDMGGGIGYNLVNIYSDGTQSEPYGWFESAESAEDNIEDDSLPVHYWTREDDYSIDEN